MSRVTIKLSAQRSWGLQAGGQLSTEIAKSHGIVKMEKLKVRNMTASADMLRYKLAERGGELKFVKPAHTSQTCPECAVVDANSRQSQSVFVCRTCGHADNAATLGARDIEQARILTVEPPKRIRKRVGKRKPLDAAHAV
jgi:putative transposase